MSVTVKSCGGGGLSSTDVTASSAQVLAGYTALTTDSNDEAKQGTIPTKTGSDLTSSGTIVTVPAGYYAQQYTKDVDPPVYIYWAYTGTTLSIGNSSISGTQSGYFDSTDSWGTREDRPWHSFSTSVVTVEILNDIYPHTLRRWFDNFTAMTTITGIANIHTDNCISLRATFLSCTVLTSDLTAVADWDVSNVMDLGWAFYNCQSILSLGDLSDWDVSSCIIFSSAFSRCFLVTSFGDLSSWNLSKATDTSYMFAQCKALTSIGDLSSWDISNVTNMKSMFHWCFLLTSLGDISNWNTSNVTNMSWVFNDCYRLATTGNFANWNTSKVTTMENLFAGCQMPEIDVSRWDTSHVTSMKRMFGGDTEEASGSSLLVRPGYIIKGLENLDTSACTTMIVMFLGNRNMTSYDLSNFDTSNVTNMSRMFEDCDTLTTIEVNASKWNTSAVTSSSDMFKNCTAIVGENGTTFDSTHTDIAYARIDAAGTPGYLTKNTRISSAGQLLKGITAYEGGVKYTGTIPTKTVSDLTTSGATVTAPSGYYATNVSKSVASGSATTPATTQSQGIPSISVDTTTGLITAAVSSSSLTVTPTVVPGYVAAGTAGTITLSSSSNTQQLTTQPAVTVTPTSSTQTVVTAGKYTTGNITVAPMPEGTLGTVSASKGTVSNHSISVTPSISTGTPGYNAMIGKSGTAVTVSASELVSGSETKTANGTYNVTNLASLTVAIPEYDYSYIRTSELLCFTANTAGSTISMVVSGTPVGTDFKTSRDGYVWTPFTPGSTSITLVNVGDKVYFKGYNPNGINSGLIDYCRFVMSGSISASGSIMSLIVDADLPCLEIPNNYCFYYLFLGCSALVSAPALPATTLSESCYSSMFEGCRNLVIPPQLPATVLLPRCYGGMFDTCSNLVTAPALPATTLAVNCYSYMFYGCSKLEQAPLLSATILADSCYSNMFYDCYSLANPPKLPATTLSSSCYLGMFYGCTNLTTPPALQATTLASGCYGSMFYGCRLLTTLPLLPATTLAKGCYNSMFYGCTSLIVSDSQGIGYDKAWRIPTSGTFTNTYNQRDMFYQCTGTRSSDAMPGASGQSYTYYTQNTPV